MSQWSSQHKHEYTQSNTKRDTERNDKIVFWVNSFLASKWRTIPATVIQIHSNTDALFSMAFSRSFLFLIVIYTVAWWAYGKCWMLFSINKYICLLLLDLNLLSMHLMRRTKERMWGCFRWQESKVLHYKTRQKKVVCHIYWFHDSKGSFNHFTNSSLSGCVIINPASVSIQGCVCLPLHAEYLVKLLLLYSCLRWLFIVRLCQLKGFSLSYCLIFSVFLWFPMYY